MALQSNSQRTDKCTNYPDFAVCCLFIEKFGDLLGLLKLNISNLQKGFEDESEEVPDLISELHIYLLRRLKKNVPVDKWERQLVQFCTTYSNWNAWELQDLGYARLKLSTKLAIIRNLLEAQFDANLKFQERLKTEIPEDDLRKQCFGRDKDGLCYWLVQDEELTINIYRVEQDDTDGSSWQVVASNRDELAILIECLKENKPIPGLPTSAAESRSATPSRCATPLSMVSTATGTVKSTCNTPSKLLISTSAKDLQEFDTSQQPPAETDDNDKQVSSDVKTEEETLKPVSDDDTDSKQLALVADTENKPANEDMQIEADNIKPDIKDEVMHKDISSPVQTPFTEYQQPSPNKQEDLPKTDQSEAITEPPSQSEDLPNTDQSEAITEPPSQSEDLPNTDQSEAITEPPSQSEDAEPGAQSEGMVDDPVQSFSSPTGVDQSQMEMDGEPEAVDEENMEEHASTDSEDNIPLSQLKQTCVLLSQAKRSLMKAKKQHEKKKYKEMLKKKRSKSQSKSLKCGSVPAMNGSPQASPIRSSNRQRKPVFQQVAGADMDLDSDYLLSDDDDYVPKGRNARRQAKRSGFALPPTSVDDVVEDKLLDNDDTPCRSCGKYTQPHLILLCDKCDSGWHTACIRPALFYIPEGDWFCPNCDHVLLVEKFESHLTELDAQLKALEAKQKRQERQIKSSLNHGINIGNIIEPEEDLYNKRVHRENKEKKLDEYDYDSWEEDYGYSLNKRSSRQRSKVSYKFEEYEDLIDSAIKGSEADPTILRGTNSRLLPPAGRSRGKDISNLLGDAGIDDVSSEEEAEKEVIPKSPPTEPILSSEKPKPKAKKRKKLNNIEGEESDAETDVDYCLSDDGDQDLAEELSEGSASEDDWLPGGARKGSRRSGRRRDDISSFICDDDEDDDYKPSSGRRAGKKTAPPRSTRTSAAAAQEAIRKRRFGFSSDESLASTPGSSSSEEETDFTTRRRNKWNTATTYSSRTAKKSEKPKKKPKKKKRRRVANYNSEQSTEQESEASDEDYVPPQRQEQQNDNHKSDGSDNEEEGVRRVNNRLESSDEEMEQEENNVKEEEDNSETGESNSRIEEDNSKNEEVNGKTEEETSKTEIDHSSTGSANSTPEEDHSVVENDINSKPMGDKSQIEENASEIEAADSCNSKSVSDKNELKSSDDASNQELQTEADEHQQDPSTTPTSVDKQSTEMASREEDLASGDGERKGIKSKKKVSQRKRKAEQAESKAESPASKPEPAGENVPVRPNQPYNPSQNTDTKKPAEAKHSQSPAIPPSTELSRLPHTVDNMLQQAPAPYNANIPPVDHLGLIRPGHHGSMPSHPQYSQPVYQHGQPLNNFNPYPYNAYHPEQHMPAGGEHYMPPARHPMRPPMQQPYHIPDGARFPPQPPVWPLNYGIPPSRYSHPAYQAPAAPSRPPAIPSQNSSAFMMDNIIQPSNDTADSKASMPSTTTAEDDDDDDEMSSYMTMASFVTSKTSS